MKPLIINTGLIILFLFIMLAGCKKINTDSESVKDYKEGEYEERFYYAFSEKVPLVVKPNTILVKYIEGTEKTQIIESIGRLTKDYTIKWHGSLTVEISVSSQKLADELLNKLKKENEVYTCQPFYTLKDGLDMGVADEILIRFLPEVTEDQQKELYESFNLTLLKTTKIYQKFRVPKGADALEIANKIYESGLVEFATPNFISYAELCQIIPRQN